jgi:hypothetical protein
MLNFKRYQSPRYRAWRILRANSLWGDLYRGALKEYGNHRGFILLPETILALADSTIYRAAFDGKDGSTTYSIRKLEKPRLWIGDRSITTVEDLLAFEEETTNLDVAKKLAYKKPESVYYDNASSAFIGGWPLFNTHTAAASFLIKKISKDSGLKS